MAAPLIPADSDFGLVAALGLGGALTRWLGAHGVGRRISGVAMGILGGRLCSSAAPLATPSPISSASAWRTG
jgi:hypothetical protein